MTVESVDFKLVEKSADKEKRVGFLGVSPPRYFVCLCNDIFVERFINFLVRTVDMKISASGERLRENNSIRVKM